MWELHGFSMSELLPEASDSVTWSRGTLSLEVSGVLPTTVENQKENLRPIIAAGAQTLSGRHHNEVGMGSREN